MRFIIGKAHPRVNGLRAQCRKLSKQFFRGERERSPRPFSARIFMTPKAGIAHLNSFPASVNSAGHSTGARGDNRRAIGGQAEEIARTSGEGGETQGNNLHAPRIKKPAPKGRDSFFVTAGNQYMSPMPPAGICIAGAGSLMSVTSASVVSRVDATDAAFCSALRVTLVGSRMPCFIMSQ